MVEEYPLHTGRLRHRLVDYESAKIVPDGQSEVNGHGKRTIKFFVGKSNSFKFSDDYYAIIRCILLLRRDLGDYWLKFMTSIYLNPKTQLKALKHDVDPSASIFSFYNNLLADQHAPFPHDLQFDPSTVNDPNILAYFELTTLHNYILEQLQRLNIKNKSLFPKWRFFNLLEKDMNTFNR
jgi:hypothetical protein